MARCMLCSSPVGEADPVCPHCGGAVEDDGADVTRVQGAAAGVDLGKDQGSVDLGKGPGDAGGAAGASWPGEVGPTTGPPIGSHGSATGPPGPTTWSSEPGPFGPPSAPPEAPPEWGTGAYPGFTYGPPAAGFGAPPGAYGYGPHSPHGYGYPPGWTPPPPPMPQEGLAMGSFITSLLGLVLASACFVPILACPVGAVLGHIALRRIEQTGKQGRGMALAGVIIGWIGTAILVIATAVIVGVVVAGS